MENKILYSDWQPWLERPFQPLVLSLFKNSVSSRYYKEIGVAKNDYPMLFQNNFWYKSDKAMTKMSLELKEYLKHNSIFDFTSSAVKFYKKSRKEIIKLSYSSDPVEYKLERLGDIFSYSTAYIMLTHGFEEYYSYLPDWLSESAISKKKIATQRMQLSLKRGGNLKKVQERYGWLRCRDKFIRPFSLKELAQEKKSFLAEKNNVSSKVKISAKYKQEVKELAELIWFRTYRTDVFYELLYLSRPILKQAARKYKIPFSELPYYSLFDLINGQLKKYPGLFSVYFYKDKFIIQPRPFIKIKKIKQQEIIGQIAFPGKVEGRVKIVKTSADLKKVKKGDILVSQMTFPSFILAMRKAAAFVTDEGGITCHAAIVAREMRKPCIIGTKVATQLLKDNLKITVDAEKGKIII